MKNSKKGFTLTEVLIVTAIIVIVSGAAIAGIAVTVANANERGQNFQAQQGENWESAAVLKVKNTKIDLGDEQTYEESAGTPTPTGVASSDNKELDGEDDPNPSPDPDPKDPDPDPNPKDPDPDPEPDSEPVVEPVVNPPSGIQTGVITSSTTTDSVEFNGYTEQKLSFDSSVQNANKVTVEYTYTGAEVTDCKNWGHLGSGAPTITIDNGKVTLEFDVSGMQEWQKSNLMNNSPQFISSGSTNIQLTSVSTS